MLDAAHAPISHNLSNNHLVSVDTQALFGIKVPFAVQAEFKFEVQHGGYFG
jgi:hypothetical protein